MKAQLKKIKPLYHLYLLLLNNKRKLYNKITIPDYAVKRQTIRVIAKKYKCTKVFIETGTYMGDTVDFLKHDFELLYSIELNDELAAKSTERFSKESKIKIVHGDSATQLSSILSVINSPVVFWLDGHYSSEFQVGDEDIVTARGAKDTPIMEELQHISNHSVKNHVILIDDARLFNGTNDYPAKDIVREFVKEKFPNHHFSIKKDIIRILPVK